MKKLFTSLFALSLFTSGVIAQSCGTNGPSVCTPQGGPQGGGFENPDSIPCIEKGVAYDYSMQLTMFSTFTFQGSHTVDSIEFVSIGNLPCGICWAVNKASKRYVANEDGCIRFQGTTNDNAGQYQLNLVLNAWIDGLSSPIPVSSFLAGQAGIKMFLRVRNGGSSNCPAVDTSASANNLTASTNCTVGINDPVLDFNSVKIAPNPFHSTAVLSFNADESNQYTMKITDVTGRIIQIQKLNVRQGVNEFEINGTTLSSGIYLLTLDHGKGQITKRFSVTE